MLKLETRLPHHRWSLLFFLLKEGWGYCKLWIMEDTRPVKNLPSFNFFWSRNMIFPKLENIRVLNPRTTYKRRRAKQFLYLSMSLFARITIPYYLWTVWIVVSSYCCLFFPKISPIYVKLFRPVSWCLELAVTGWYSVFCVLSSNGYKLRDMRYPFFQKVIVSVP